MSNAGEEKDFMTGRLLLAMPQMGDPRFHKAVIYVCAHDENGAMGLVINSVLPGVDMSELLSQLNIDLKDEIKKSAVDMPVLSGGPVETARGFVLHSSDFQQDDTIEINEKVGVTGTIDALKAIAAGKGPEKMLFLLGYAGWSKGQLDQEIQQNAWLITEADSELIFSATPDEKWDLAVKKLGIDPGMLSGSAGSA